MAKKLKDQQKQGAVELTEDEIEKIAGGEVGIYPPGFDNPDPEPPPNHTPPEPGR